MDRTQLETALATKYGMNLGALHRDALTQALHARMLAVGIDDDTLYFQALSQNEDEWQSLVELLVVPETWFFRDSSAFEYFIHYVNTQWLKRQGTKPLSILCVACSTGEEPYSVAMTLIDAGLRPEQFTITAVDISRAALEKANEGLYRPHSFRGKELSFRDRHFVEEQGHYRLQEALRHTVKFRHVNVFQEVFRADRDRYDVIFCRNLLIYLHSHAQQDLLSHFKELLSEDGVLIVGAGETSAPRNVGFFPVKFPGSHAFSKKNASPPEPKAAPQPTQQPKRSDYLLTQAGDLANAGQLDKASELCHEFVKDHPHATEAHFILGLIAHAKGSDTQAEKYFHQVVHLDPNHYESLVYLALLEEKKGDDSRSLHYRQRAADVLKKRLPH